MGNSANKQHAKRVQRCLQSFPQLQADIKHVNLHLAAEFARLESPSGVAPLVSSEGSHSAPDAEAMLIQFRPFTKLVKKSALPWLWSVNDNVVIAATIISKREADAMLATTAAPTPIPPAAPSMPYPASRSLSLTVREFYSLFLYMCDNASAALTLRDQVLKIEHPAQWASRQAQRRRDMQAQLARGRKTTAGGPESSADEEKEEKSAAAAGIAAVAETGLAPVSLSRASSVGSDASAALSGSVPSECSICLTNPDEDAVGDELVVLSCLHAYCEDCISEWRAQSATCPLCRRDLDDSAEEDADSWSAHINAAQTSMILTSPNLATLRSSLQRIIDHPFSFVRSRPPFPPPASEGARGEVRNAGDAFSLVFGEVLDAFTPGQPQRKQQQQQPQQPRKETEMPVARPVDSPAVSSPEATASSTQHASAAPPLDGDAPAAAASNSAGNGVELL